MTPSENPRTTEIVCKHCTRVFQVKNSSVKYVLRTRGKLPIFCSKSCDQAHRQENRRVSRFTCERCGSDFERPTAEVTWRHAKGVTPPQFCSVACRNHVQRSERQSEVTCEQCSKSFTRSPYAVDHAQRHFCSLECMGAARRTGRNISCECCNKDFYVSGHRLRRHKTYYCCNACRLKHQFQLSGATWEKFSGGSQIYRKLVDRIRKSEPYVNWRNAVMTLKLHCSFCPETSGLHAHHIFPLAEIIQRNGYDEAAVVKDPLFLDTTNGMVVCTNCHAKIHGIVPTGGDPRV